jgi:hypothetical protein
MPAIGSQRSIARILISQAATLLQVIDHAWGFPLSIVRMIEF